MEFPFNKIVELIEKSGKLEKYLYELYYAEDDIRHKFNMYEVTAYFICQHTMWGCVYEGKGMFLLGDEFETRV